MNCGLVTPVETLVDLQRIYEKAITLMTPKQYLVLTSAYNHLQRMVEDPSAFPAARLRALQQMFTCFLKNNTRLKPKTIADYRDVLTAMLRHAVTLGILEESLFRAYGDFPIGESPAPRRERERFLAYRGFVLWCLKEGYSLADCRPGVFCLYAVHLRCRPKNQSSPRVYNRLLEYWNSGSSVGELPVIELPPFDDRRRVAYGLQYDQWPPDCRAQFGVFESLKSDESDENLASDVLPVEPRTLWQYRTRMTLFLGYVRKFVTDISTMNLVELLRNTHLVERFILWHAAERTGGHERTGHAAMLRLFSAVLEANLGKNPTSDQYRAMSNSINKIPAKAFHADLVLDFDRIALAAELCLRDARRDYDLWVAAGKLERDVLEVAFRFMLALLFALLTWRPVRCKNLCGLALDQNLQFHGERGWWLYFSAHETKTGTEIDVPFPALLTEALGIYLEHLRPTLNRLDLPNLFFQDSGKPFSGAALWRSLIPLGEKYLGVPTSSHTFRRLIPTAYLIAHPGEVEVCRALLSHRLVSTTIKHYAFVFTLYASRRLPAFLRESCPDSGLVAVWRPIYLKSVETVLPS